jgi:hypothetical protein
MTDLTFQNPDEARAWDMYVAGLGERTVYRYLYADQAILERRKRMAPEKVEREWISHKPGDPMPCDGETVIEVQMRSGIVSNSSRALLWSWEETGRAHTILAWRPA